MANLAYSIVRAAPAEFATPLLALPHFEGESAPSGAAAEVDSRLQGQLSRIIERGDFRGNKDEALVVYPPEGVLGAERIVLIGLGRRDDFTLERLRRGVGAAVRQAERVGAGGLALTFGFQDGLPAELAGRNAAQAATEAAVLAAWDFRAFKTQGEGAGHGAGPIAGGATADRSGTAAAAEGTNARAPRLSEFVLLARDEAEEELLREGARHGDVVARGENLARELQSSPGNVATPSHLASVAERIGRERKLEVTILDRAAMEEEGMGALLAVAQGSEEEPRFIVLEYRGAGAPEGGPLVLVGKGVTFDSGGISIKPAANMEEMKYDMSGAAAVLGATQAIAELGLPVHLVSIIPSTENLLSGKAVKPGDIIRSHLGKTIEVVNTDAEGRLILADALSYAQRYNPRAIVDAATLTGACVIALGNYAIGLMGTDQELVDEVRAAGERTGERCWQLPLWDEFRPQIDSNFADLKNTGGRPAGTITAGLFLKEFAGTAPWAHLDIAGTAYRDEPTPYLRKGATGVPTRLFVEWVRARTTH
jgi:leucyl aminopeptidase